MNMNPSSPSCRRSRYLSAAVSAVLSLAATTAAQAEPQNGNVTRGAATISTPNAGLTQIDQSSRSVSIDWQSFDVAANERVVFNQPSANAVALNRILSQDPSQIHGSLLANGRVFLLNPNGIIFGATARINVGSLVASSLDLTGMDEVADRYSFGTAAASSGAIVNEGRIAAADGGSVTLLGGSVVNRGWIVADYGTVNLGAGRAATLSFDADGLVRFQVDAGLLETPAGVDAVVNNTGEIAADGGQVLLTARQAGDVIARAVNNDGVIRAARVDNSGGRIRLLGPEGEVASGGTLDASSSAATGVGGEVQVLGERVTFSGTSLVDVSGGAGGGTALIGGSFNGADPAVLNSQHTGVQQGAVIRADATVSGDAGRVAVWSDGTTTFNGDILARAQGTGNGGYAEVSGRQHLLISGHAQLGSAQGAAGTLLLDPGSVDIVNGNNTAPGGQLDTIRDGWIVAQLAGSNLTVSTNTSTNTQTENLTVAGNANISWDSAFSLTLIGDDSLTLAAGSRISNDGSGGLTLQSGGAVALGGTVTLAGDLTVTAGANITQSAALSVGGVASFATGSGQSILLGNAGNSFAGTVGLGATSGTLLNATINDSTALDLQTLSVTGNLTAISGGGLTQSGALNVGGNASFTAAAGQSIVLGNANNVFSGAVALLSGGSGNLQNVTISDSTALTLQALSVDGNLTASSGGALNQSGGALLVAGNASFTAAAGQSITLGNAGNSFTGAVTLASGGPGNLQDVTIADATAFDLQALTLGGDLTVSSGGGLTQSGALSVAGDASFTAAAGQSLSFIDGGNVFGGTVSFASGGPGNLQNVSVNDSTALDLGALALSGNLIATSGGSITQSGALDIGGSASFTAAAAQSITLDDANNAFADTVTFAGAGLGNLQNVTVVDSTALDLQALTLAGNLSATSGAGLTQSGVLAIAGNSTFNAAAGQSITLGYVGNTFTGAVTLAATGPGTLTDVMLRDGTALNLQALAISGDLTIMTGGPITQSGNLSVAGDASFRTQNDAGAAITLGGANSFGSVQAAVRNGVDTANAAANIVINESNSTLLGDIQTGAGQSVSITSAGAITARANTDIAAGSLTLAAGGGIGSATTAISLIAANGRLDATSTGNVYVENTGGVVLDRAVAGNSGSLNVSSNGDIRVADVRAGSSVSLTAGGSILDDAVDGAGSQIVTGVLSLQAAGAIGEATGIGNGMLELRTDAVTANAAGGGVYLDEVGGDLGIRRIEAAGPVALRAAAGSIVDDASDAAAAAIVSTAGGIQLRALDNIGTVTDIANRQGSALGIDTRGGALSAQVTSAAGQINLDIASGSNPTGTAGAIAAGGAGRLLLQSSGDLTLAAFTGAFSGFAEAGFSADGTLTLTSGLMATPLATLLLRGAVDVVQANRTFDLSAGRLSFESGGLGGGVTLNTNTGRFDGSIGNGADLTLVNAADLTLGSVAGGGNVSIRAANILDDGDAGSVTRVTAGGRISLESSGGIGQADGVGNGRIDTAGASVSLLAADSAYLSHQGNLQVAGEAGGAIDIATPGGSITVGPALRANSLALVAGSDAVGAAVAGNIVLSGTAQATSTAALTARGGGTITDADDASTHLVAGDTRLQAASIGTSGNALTADLGSLNATAINGLYLQEANDLQLGSVSAQTIAIAAGGRITDDGKAQTRLTAADVTLSGTSIGAAGAGNEIDTAVDRLSAIATNGGIYVGEDGDIALGTVSAAGTGNDIAIVATGAIADDGDSATRIAGGNLTLQASSVGAANGPLQTQVTSLSAAAASGGVFVNEADDLQVNSVTAAGNVALSVGGVLSDDGNSATRVSGDSVTLAATRIGSDAARIGTAAASLTATASDGGIYIAEQDGITLASVRSSGNGNTVDLRTGNNGNIAVQELVTQGGAVNLAAGGTGSLTVTGAIESNNGVVNLTSGDALALPGLDSGTGSIVLHTVNDLNVGSVVGGSISITSDTGDISLGAVNAGSGVVSITAANGVIRDDVGTSLIAGQATLLAQSIGSDGNALNVNVGTLTANATAGGLFIDDIGGLTVADVRAAGPVGLTTTGALLQAGAIVSGGQALSVIADSIDMGVLASTLSGGGDIFYLANAGSATLAVLDAATGRVLVMAADSVYSALAANTTTNNLTGSMVEVRAGGLGGAGEIGTVSSPLSIATPGSSRQSVYLIVPAVNGIQTSTPSINYAGGASAVLLKGYSGSSGALFFDRTSAFTPDTILSNGESIVPLRNGRVAVNTDSLSAAKQALSSGVVTRINVDWAAFDPDVSLFGTLDPALRLPQDQVEEPVPEAGSMPAGTGQ